MIEMHNTDCMGFMRSLPDKAFDLAVADPPYGLPKESSSGSGKLKSRAFNKGNIARWDVRPGQDYFNELSRVARHQIIFGGNYFPLPPSRGVIAWDKIQPWKNFSQFELIWTSFDRPAALFRLGNRHGKKIHPTQKPVALYRWLLENYARKGDRILDTHLGSGSIALACHALGFDLVGCEIDKGYFDAASERLALFTRQQHMGPGARATECKYESE